jgi:hypothetical protein
MRTPIEDVIDALSLVGLLGFPPYLLYWAIDQIGQRAFNRLWIGAAGIAGWCLATIAFLVYPMMTCMGGHCAGKVSPFLEFSIAYAASSVALVGALFWLRKPRPPLR